MSVWEQGGSRADNPREAAKEWISEWYLAPTSTQPVARIVISKECECFIVDDVVEAYEREHSAEFGWYEEDRKITLPSLNQQSRENLRSLLYGIKEHFVSKYGCKTAQIAYMLATVRLEAYDWTRGVFFGPVAEKISYERAEVDYGSGPTARDPDRARRYGHSQVGDGYGYRGRGFVQITWKENYAKFSSTIGVDLVAQPDLALEFDVALKIMIAGMTKGLFTGHKLSDHLNDTSSDFFNARRIINGTDRASTIAEYAKRFEALLTSTGCSND